MDEDEFPIDGYLRSRGYDGAELTSRWRSIRCLFHEDTHASARANETGYACLACGIKGSTITLIMKVENVDADRAYEIAEKTAGGSGSGVPQSAARKRRRGISSFGEAHFERGSGLFSSGGRPEPFEGG